MQCALMLLLYLSFSSHQTYSMGDMRGERHRHTEATKLHLHKILKIN